ncbi:hypothetical protein CBD41_09700 [bacterium TMED181]|nr:hypothetical protein [Planctomycetota bacterium]OUW42153.1 MAG: hypothetical protein CBD41_09700 [bacterium TMED181]
MFVSRFLCQRPLWARGLQWARGLKPTRKPNYFHVHLVYWCSEAADFWILTFISGMILAD